jgi:hypothetical protein
MEILIVLGAFLVLTVLVLGWTGGSTFICTFLTLILGAVVAVLALGQVESPVAGFCLLAIIPVWVPWFWHRRRRQAY